MQRFIWKTIYKGNYKTKCNTFICKFVENLTFSKLVVKIMFIFLEIQQYLTHF